MEGNNLLAPYILDKKHQNATLQIDLGILLGGYMLKSNPGSYSQKFSNIKNGYQKRRKTLKKAKSYGGKVDDLVDDSVEKEDDEIEDKAGTKKFFVILTYFGLHWYKRDVIDELFGDKAGCIYMKDIIAYKKVSTKSFEITTKDKKRRIFSVLSNSSDYEDNLDTTEEEVPTENYFAAPIKYQNMNYPIDLWLFCLNEAIKFNKDGNRSSRLEKDTSEVISYIEETEEMLDDEDTILTENDMTSPISNGSNTVQQNQSKSPPKFFKLGSQIASQIIENKQKAYEKYAAYINENFRKNQLSPIEKIEYIRLHKTKRNENLLVQQKLTIKERTEFIVGNMEDGDFLEIVFSDKLSLTLSSNEIRQRINSGEKQITTVHNEDHASSFFPDLDNHDIDQESTLADSVLAVNIQLKKADKNSIKVSLSSPTDTPVSKDCNDFNLNSNSPKTASEDILSPASTVLSSIWSDTIDSTVIMTSSPLPFYKDPKYIFISAIAATTIINIKSSQSYFHLFSSLIILFSISIYLLKERSRKAKQIPPFTFKIKLHSKYNDAEADKNSLEYILEHPPKVFIEGCLGNMIEAKERWEVTYFWREEVHPETFLSKPHPHLRLIKQNWANYHLGKTKNNDIIMIDRPGEMNMENLVANKITIEDLVHHTLYCVEFFYQKLADDPENQRIVSVFDVGGVQLHHVSGLRRQFLKQALGLLQQHYPERSRAILLINAPGWFETIWNFVSTLLEERVRQKVNIASKNNSKALLEKYIPIENIPTEYGGEMEFKAAHSEEIYPDNCRFFHPSEKLLLNHAAKVNADHGVSFTDDINEEIQQKYNKYYTEDVKC